jgi:hypothetical protein
MKNSGFDLRRYRNVLFPLACLFLIAFGFGFDAFENGFAETTLWAVFGLLVIELLIVILKKRYELWSKLKWYILGIITLLILLG